MTPPTDSRGRRSWTVKGAATSLIAFLLLFATGSAKQLWIDINKYDANGDLCPATSASEDCPAICVYDLDNCPQPVSCPDGQSLCHDGECHDECTDKINSGNPCFCGWQTKHVPTEAHDLVPCPIVGSVKIDQLYLWNKTDQVRDVCANKAEVSDQDSYGIWGKEWPRHDAGSSGTLGVWSECPKEPQELYTFREPMWIAIFAVVFGFVALLGLWFIFKKLMQLKLRSAGGLVAKQMPKTDAASVRSGGSSAYNAPAAKSGQIVAAVSGSSTSDEKGEGFNRGTSDDSNDLNSDDIRISGYRNNIFGTLMTWYLLVLSALWLCFLFVLSADYYGSLPNTPKDKTSILSYYDSTLGTQAFIGMWCFFVFLVVTVTAVRFRLRNFFRIKTLPQNGQFVCVEQKIHKAVMLAGHNNFLVKHVQMAADRIKHMLGWDWNVTTCPVHLTGSNRKYFTYQCTRFVFSSDDEQFAPFSFDLGSQNNSLVAKAGGLTTEEATLRAELIGPNFIEVQIPSWFGAFVREVSSFVFLYQSLALIVFMFDAYYKVGLVDLAVVLLAVAFSMVVKKLSEERLKRMAEQSDQLMALRDGSWVEVSSRDLVPGDVIRVTTGMQMSCDGILISGNAVMNESSLTGEALPIRKFPLRNDDSGFSKEANKNNQLFAGTVVSQVQPVTSSNGDYLTDDHVLCLVNHTGTASDKGKLVRKILFPQPISFVFDEQLKVVFTILGIYVLFCLAMAIYFYQGSPTATWLYFQFVCFQALSPILPAGILAGQSMAVFRLKRRQIYCVDPRRVMIAAKCRIMNFDKTGTLTNEGLEFYGVQRSRFVEEKDAAEFEQFTGDLGSCDELLQIGVASCHAVTDLGDQLIGNPVDIEQFKASKWTLDKEPKFLDKIVPPQDSALSVLHVARRFEFVHARASMSVVVQDERDGQLHVFVKGSFERIKALSNARTIPAGYDAACNQLAREGGYVLAFAHMILDATLDQLRTMEQDDIETGCDFIGLLVFKNMLKPDTAQAISELKGGSIRTVMVTGDTALTGIFIARQCGMVPPENTVVLGDIDKKTGRLIWTDVDSDEPVADIEPLLDTRGPDGFPLTELAVTGAAFNYLDEAGQMAPLLLNTRVFARMKPQDKVRCTQMTMERGITGMCGDGGNDTAALRAAHVGIALSDAEAAIVSPFSSSNRSVMSCVELLIQSRAGLATSFANYRALILYGTTMTMHKIITFWFSNSLSDTIWIIIDALIATSMAISVTFLPAAKKLAKYRPTAQVLGPEILASVLGIVAINWLFMACVWVWLYKQSFFRCNEFDSSNINVQFWYLLGDNYEAAVLTFVVIYQFINNGLMVNYGYIHRRSFFHNPALLCIAAGLFIMMSYAQLGPPSRLSCAFRVNCGTPSVLESLGYNKPNWYIQPYSNSIGHNVLPDYAKWTLWGYAIGNMVAGHIWQVVFVYGPVRTYLRKRFPLRRLKIKL